VLAEYDYTFDLADQLVREVDHGLVSEYTYDPAGQLTAVEHNGQGDETYAYDANGNRVGGPYTVGPNNQVLTDAEYDYEYDAEGNLIRKTERASGIVSRYAYDHRNRLVRLEQSSADGILLAAADYVYDVFDRRIVKSVDRDGSGPLPPQETRFVYDGLNAWADFDGGNQVLARYLHGEGLDNLLARWRPDGGTAWYLGDHLGSVRDMIDAVGAIVNRLAYDSFGQLVSQTNPAAGDRFAFTGREYDPELGLYYYRARYYDPQLGRFVSQDPLGFAAGDSNLYRYVGNAPLTARDPLGLAAVGLFYGLIARRSSMAAGAVVGGVLGFACGWVEGFTEASSAGAGDSESAAGAALQRASSYAAVGVALGGTLAGLPSAVQFYGGGILLGAAAGMIIRQAPQDPWQVTAVRVGCVVLSAAVAPAAHRWLTPRIERLPYMGPRSPHAPASPTPLVPRGQAGGAVEPAPAPRHPSSRQGTSGRRSAPPREVGEHIHKDVAKAGFDEYAATAVKIQGDRVYALLPSNGGSGPLRWIRMNRRPPTSTHGNSLSNGADTHVYAIRNPKGQAYKVGESAGGVRAGDGQSIRAEQQVRDLIREFGPGFTSQIRHRGGAFPGKAAGRSYETKFIKTFRRLFGDDTLPGNLTDR